MRRKKFILIVVLTIYDIMWISRYSHDRNIALFFHVPSIWHWTENVHYLTFGCWIYYHTKHPLNLQMYVWNYVITSIRIFPGLLPWLHPIIHYICTNTLLLFMRFLFLQVDAWLKFQTNLVLEIRLPVRVPYFCKLQ